MRRAPVSQTTPSDPVLTIEGLSSGYRHAPVIRDISFTTSRGVFLGLLGPNGSGKTTLLLTVSGVLRSTSGTVTIFGRTIERYSRRERAQYIAAMPQEQEFHFPFSCEEIVWMGRYPWKSRFRPYRPEDADAVRWAMDLTHTRHLAHRLILEISGGERQRVLLARLLAQKAPLCLLDEPTANMDVRWTMETFRTLKNLCHEEGVTIIAAIHDINTAALFCDQLMFLKEGRVVAAGPVTEVFQEHILQRVYETPVRVSIPQGFSVPQALFLPR